MVTPSNTIPAPTPGPNIPVTVGRDAGDYNLPPPATNPPPAQDVEPPPPITNTHLPDPKILNKAAVKPTPRELSITAAKKTDPEPFAFGHCICDGKLIAADDSGDNLIMDLLWNGYPSDYHIGMWVDGIFEGRADMLGKMQYFEGQPGQVVSSIMDALKGNDYDVLEGKAHSVHTWNPAYPTLQLRMEGRWTLCWDPRLSPQDYVWTKNPALILAFVMVELGYTMNWASVATAANYCDEPLGSPEVKRWEVGGQLLQRLEAEEIIKLLAIYADCYVDRIGGEVYLIPDTPRSANHTVTTDDMIPDTIKVGHAGTGNVPEAVIAYGLTLEGKEISYTYGTPGGPGTVTELRLPYFQSVHTLGRKAEETYKKAQADDSIEFVAFDNSIRRTIGDVATVTNAAFELDEELMVLIDTEEVSRGRWRRKYVKYDPDHNSDELYTDSSTSTTLDNPHRPPEGPTPSVTEETYTPYAAEWNETYTYNRRLKIEWTGQTWPYLKDYLVTIETGGVIVQSEYVPHIVKSGSPLAEQTHTTYSAFPLEEGAQYIVKVYMRSNVLATSADPGIAYIVASVLFYSADESSSGSTQSWADPANALVDDGGTSYAQMEWENDEDSYTNYLDFTYSLADNGVPDDATITHIQATIRLSSSVRLTPVNIYLSLISGSTSPAVVGNVKTFEVDGTDSLTYFLIFTLEGDLTYWGLTNAQAMDLFDDSGNGTLRIQAEAEDTLEIPSPGVQRIRIDWVKVGVTFTPA